jgi:hypothetical protein
MVDALEREELYSDQSHGISLDYVHILLSEKRDFIMSFNTDHHLSEQGCLTFLFGLWFEICL